MALAAVSVAAAGPIGFLALAAPQLAKRLARSAGITLVVSIAMGSTLLVVADFAAQRVLSPFQIPVGLVTGAVGGLYLLWLLSATGRR
ncbi:iron chelate uptake ABC transporter family permease subunit [Gordonia humi]|uniref:iron chelate uptake ABC transporter family permease subunit n=1 Tax=Gordonia humi TaxID=686429 RepID=UPI00362248FB